MQALLDYCGLPMEEQCLRFHETERAVNTASSEQVRQPIYTSAVAYWRHFEEQLQPLKDALGDLAEALIIIAKTCPKKSAGKLTGIQSSI